MRFDHKKLIFGLIVAVVGVVAVFSFKIDSFNIQIYGWIVFLIGLFLILDSYDFWRRIREL